MPAPREAHLLFVLGAVQFVNVLDFMMVMPLGPFFATDLGIPGNKVAQVGAAYTGAAAVAGLLLSPVLDRLDRRSALLLTLLGLFLGTLVGGLATGINTLLAARVVAGLFGGPASAVALAIVTDLIPAERRGAAMGKVLGAFSISSIVGVPAGLYLANHGSWRTPFFAVAALGLGIAGLAWLILPKMVAHLEHAVPHRPADVLRLPGVPLALLSVTGMTMGGFAVIPSLPIFIQYNLAFQSDAFWKLYLVGGLCSFALLQFGGRWVDRWGSLRIAMLGTAFLSVALSVLALGDPRIPPYLLFVFFMAGNSLRNVAWQALASRLPPADLRAGYLSLQGAVQHGGAAVGALLSTAVLTERADGGLDGMPVLAGLSFVLFLVALWPMLRVARHVGMPR